MEDYKHFQFHVLAAASVCFFFVCVRLLCGADEQTSTLCGLISDALCDDI